MNLQQGRGRHTDTLTDPSSRFLGSIGEPNHFLELLAGKLSEQPRLGVQPRPQRLARLPRIPVARFRPRRVELMDAVELATSAKSVVTILDESRSLAVLAYTSSASKQACRYSSMALRNRRMSPWFSVGSSSV